MLICLNFLIVVNCWSFFRLLFKGTAGSTWGTMHKYCIVGPVEAFLLQCDEGVFRLPLSRSIFFSVTSNDCQMSFSGGYSNRDDDYGFRNCWSQSWSSIVRPALLTSGGATRLLNNKRFSWLYSLWIQCIIVNFHAEHVSRLIVRFCMSYKDNWNDMLVPDVISYAIWPKANNFQVGFW